MKKFQFIVGDAMQMATADEKAVDEIERYLKDRSFEFFTLPGDNDSKIHIRKDAIPFFIEIKESNIIVPKEGIIKL